MPRIVKEIKNLNTTTPFGPEVESVLVPLMRLLLKSGFSREKLLEECRLAVQRAGLSKSKLKVARIPFRQDETTLVNRWLRDPNYLNPMGRPRDLPMRGDLSVKSLVDACGLKLRLEEVTTLLMEFKIVKKFPNGRFRLVRRFVNYGHPNYLSYEPNLQFLIDATRAATDRLLPTAKTPGVFWRKAENIRIRPKHTKEFLRFVDQRSLSFMYEINDWLDEHESDAEQSKTRSNQLKRLGVGLFCINSNC